MSKKTATAETETETGTEGEDSTALQQTGEGELAHGTRMADLIASGFSEERTIKIGDPTAGDAIMSYAGEFIGPGADVELNEAASGEGKTIPTWCFHPMNVQTLKPIYAITHTVICPTILDGICKRLQAMKLATGKRVQASFMWDGMGKNRVGQPLNRFRSAHRLINDDGSVFVHDTVKK